MARLLASVALAVKMTPGGAAEQPRHLGPRAIERRPGLQTSECERRGIADAALQEGRIRATTRGSTGEKPA